MQTAVRRARGFSLGWRRSAWSQAGDCEEQRPCGAAGLGAEALRNIVTEGVEGEVGSLMPSSFSEQMWEVR